jgi:hypothetical protein
LSCSELTEPPPSLILILMLILMLMLMLMLMLIVMVMPPSGLVPAPIAPGRKRELVQEAAGMTQMAAQSRPEQPAGVHTGLPLSFTTVRQAGGAAWPGSCQPRLQPVRGAQQCVLDQLGACWTSSVRAGPARFVLDQLGACWTSSVRAGPARCVLDQLGASWTSSVRAGPARCVLAVVPGGRAN